MPTLIILPLLSYLFGSISSAVIVCRMMRLPDPRSSGSNNPGATNVLRIGGKKAAAITLFGDALKGLLPVLIARIGGGDALLIAAIGLAAFVGHLYPLFFRFHGGKGVATAGGVFIGLDLILAAGLIAVWFVAAIGFRYSSLAALIAAAAAPFLAWAMLGNVEYILMATVIAGLLFCRHRENIRRLKAGTEGKIRLNRT